MILPTSSFSGDLFGGITFKDDEESAHAGILYNYQNDELEFKNDITTLRLHETGVLSLTGGGKLGIGTSLPAAQLHIKNADGAGNPTSSDVDIFLEDANAYMEISATGTSGYTFKDDGVSARSGMLYSYLEDRLIFLTNGFARLNILDNGNIGIGTVSPVSKLQVEGTIEVDQKIKANDSGGLELATDEGTIRIKIADNGNVGIGTTTPSYGLHYVGGATSDIAEFYNSSTSPFADVVRAKVNQATPASTQYFYKCIDGNGNTNGGVRANGSGGIFFATTSDKRLKMNITDFSGALDLIENMYPKEYEFRKVPGKKHFGFIAQELKTVYPLAVTGDENSNPELDPMMIDYSKLSPLLAAATKELYQKVKDQQHEIDTIKEENTHLTVKINRLAQENEAHRALLTKLTARIETMEDITKQKSQHMAIEN